MLSGKCDNLREQDLAFFGRVGADVSHDMRNVLAIIGEYAGLMDDLLAASKRRKPADVEQLRTLSGKIVRRVEQGTEIMARFSRFSHAADEPVASFDVVALARNTAALAHRSVKLAGCTLVTELPAQAIPIRSNAFRMQQAVFAAIEMLLASMNSGEALTLKVEKRADLASCTIAGKTESDGKVLQDRVEQLSSCMKKLNASIETSCLNGILAFNITYGTT